MSGVDALDVYRGVRVVVLGGTGFLGRRVVDRLVALGATPILLCRTKPRLEASWEGRVAVDEGSITSLKGLKESLATCFAFNGASLVINLAAAGVLPSRRDPQTTASTNGMLPEVVATTVAELAADLPTRWPGTSLLHVGSALEYGVGAASVDEAAPCAPDEPYGKSKLRGTRAVVAARNERGLAALVARPFTVFGPGEPAGRLLPTLLCRVGDDAPIPLTSGAQLRDVAYVDDVAEGILRLAASPRRAVLAREGPYDVGVINLATGVSTSVEAFVRAAAAEFFIDPARLAFGALPQRDDETRQPEAPVARLRAATGGWTPSADFAAGLRKTHRRLLASLYAPAPKAEEKDAAPPKARPADRSKAPPA